SGLATLAMIRSLDEIRSQIDQMVDHERFLQVDQERRGEALEQRKAWLIATAIVIVAVLAGVALALARLEAVRRRRATEENVQLQSDIQARDKKIRRLVDSNIIGIIIWEVEGRILEANDEFLRMVGYDREDLIAGHLHRTTMTPPEWRDRDARTVAELKRIGTAQPFETEYVRHDGSRVPVLIGKTRWEGPYLEPEEEAWRKHRETLDAHLPFRDFELARLGPDGSKRYVSVSGLPVFDDTGRFVGYRGVGRHITERRRAEEALR